MSDINGIIPLNPNNEEHLEAAARLHAILLPDSPIPKLGKFFMKKFYYKKLVKAELIYCDLYYQSGVAVAFSSYTGYPYTFMGKGRDLYFFYLAGVLLVSLLASPLRIWVIWNVMRQARLRGLQSDCGTSGEYLSLGVMPECLSFKDPDTGLRIPNLMFERVIDYFKGRRFREILLMIKKSNKKSQMFYHVYGAVMKDGCFVPKDCYLKTIPTGL